MRTKLLTITGLLSLTLLVATPPTAAHAQTDCGATCGSCGRHKKEGKKWDEFGQYDMDCPLLGGGSACNTCDFGIADAGPGAEDILKRVSSASSLELASLVEENLDRLLLNPSRNLLVVRQGTSCNAYALGGVMTVGTKRMKELEELGIPFLEDFLRSEAVLSGREYGSW